MSEADPGESGPVDWGVVCALKGIPLEDAVSYSLGGLPPARPPGFDERMKQLSDAISSDEVAATDGRVDMSEVVAWVQAFDGRLPLGLESAFFSRPLSSGQFPGGVRYLEREPDAPAPPGLRWAGSGVAPAAKPRHVRQKEAKWTLQELADLAADRESLGTEAAAKKHGISGSRLRKLLPKPEPTPTANNPFPRVR